MLYGQVSFSVRKCVAREWHFVGVKDTSGLLAGKIIRPEAAGEGKNTKKILFNARKALTADGRRAMIFSNQKVRGAASAAETVKAEPL